jgi:hypothetical protein
MIDDKHRYRPRRLEEIEDNGLSIINEPITRDGTVSHPRWWSERALRPVLSEALAATRALLVRLERGVYPPRDREQRARYETTIRELYLRSQDQLRVLEAALDDFIELE